MGTIKIPSHTFRYSLFWCVLKGEQDKRKAVGTLGTKVAGHRIEGKEKNPPGCGENSTNYSSCQRK